MEVCEDHQLKIANNQVHVAIIGAVLDFLIIGASLFMQQQFFSEDEDFRLVLTAYSLFLFIGICLFIIGAEALL